MDKVSVRMWEDTYRLLTNELQIAINLMADSVARAQDDRGNIELARSRAEYAAFTAANALRYAQRETF